MRTHDGDARFGFQKEFSRRIRVVRKKLGYGRQAEMAEVLGFGQQQMSNWERGLPPIKEWDAVRERLTILARYLADPESHESQLGRKVEPTSPLAKSAPGAHSFVDSITDKTLSPNEWDHLCASFLMGSKAPWQRVTGDFSTDLKVHGHEFFSASYRCDCEDFTSAIPRDFVLISLGLASRTFVTLGRTSEGPSESDVRRTLAEVTWPAVSGEGKGSWRFAMDFLTTMVEKVDSLEALEGLTRAYRQAMSSAGLRAMGPVRQSLFARAKEELGIDIDSEEFRKSVLGKKS